MKTEHFRIAALTSLLTCLTACLNTPDPIDLVIRDATLLDPVTAETRRGTVLVDDGKILGIVDPEEQIPSAHRMIEGHGLYATPVLWDAHVHLAEDTPQQDALAILARFGVLGARDAGGHIDQLRAWSGEASSGERLGPEILISGPTINGPGDDSYHLEITDSVSAVEAVDRLASQNVDWIKVHRLIDPDLLPIITERAHHHGLRVFGHIPHGMTPLAACEAGMDGIEHISSILEAIVYSGSAEDLPAAVAELDSEATEAFIACLAERHVSVTPTLALYHYLAGDDERAMHMSERLITALGPFVRRLGSAGVRLLIGTDAPLDGDVPWGEAFYREWRLLADAGITPATLFRATTSEGAAYLGGNGRPIAADENASFLLFDVNPASAVPDADNLRFVIANGRIVERSSRLR